MGTSCLISFISSDITQEYIIPSSSQIAKKDNLLGSKWVSMVLSMINIDY